MYFWLNLRAFWPCIDSNTTTTFMAQKDSKDIVAADPGHKLRFVLFSHKKVLARSFIKLRLKHWWHMDYFNNVLTTFLGLERGSCIVV